MPLWFSLRLQHLQTIGNKKSQMFFINWSVLLYAVYVNKITHNGICQKRSFGLFLKEWINMISASSKTVTSAWHILTFNFVYLGLRDSNFKYVYVEDMSSSLFPAPEHQWWPGIPSYRGWERCLQTAPPSGQSRGSTIAHQDSSGTDLISVVTLDITSLALLLFHFLPPPTFFSVGPIYWT